MMAAGFYVLAGRPPARSGHSVAPWIGVGMTFYLTFLFSMQLPWAFRGDLDHIEILEDAAVASHTPWRSASWPAAILVLTAIQLVLFAMLDGRVPGGLAVDAGGRRLLPPVQRAHAGAEQPPVPDLPGPAARRGRRSISRCSAR